MENTSFCPVRKQQINYDWSDVQTTEFEKPVHNWGPVQTIKYEKPINNWGPVQTTPIEQRITTTRYEAQGHTWSPVQTAKYGPPVVWGASNQPIEVEKNMALQHQVFDTSEDESVKDNDDNEVDEKHGEGTSKEATIPVTPAGVTLGDDANDGANVADADTKTAEMDLDSRPKTSESEASLTPPATPNSPPKGILRPTRRNSSPVSVHFTEDTLPPAPGPPEPLQSPNSPKLADTLDKKVKKKDVKKDKKVEKKSEKKVEKKAKERAPEPAKLEESEKDVNAEPPAQAKEADKAEKQARSEKASKPEKTSKNSSKNQKKKDKGGKGKDKGKSKAVVAPVIPGTSATVLSDGNGAPSTEPMHLGPNPSDLSLSSSNPPSEGEPSSESAAKNAEPSDPSLPTEVKETGESAIDDSLPPSDPVPPPEEKLVESSEPPVASSPAPSTDTEPASEPPVASSPAPSTDTEPASEPTNPSDLTPASESDAQPGAAERNYPRDESGVPAPLPNPEPFANDREDPLPPPGLEQATKTAAPEPVETLTSVEGSQESNEAPIFTSAAENQKGTGVATSARVEEGTAPPINDESSEPLNERIEGTDHAGIEDAKDIAKNITPEPESIPSPALLPVQTIGENPEALSSDNSNATPKDAESPVEHSESEAQEQAKPFEGSSSEELAKENSVVEIQTVETAAPEGRVEDSTSSSSDEAPETSTEPSESAHEQISEPESNPREPIEDNSQELPSETSPVEEKKVQESRTEKVSAEITVASGEKNNGEIMGDSTPGKEIADSNEEAKPGQLSSESQEAGSGGDIEDTETIDEEFPKGTDSNCSALSNIPEPPSESVEGKGAETEHSDPSEHADSPSSEATEQENSTETEPSASSEHAETASSNFIEQERGTETEPSPPSESEETLAPSSEIVEGAQKKLGLGLSQSEAKEESPASNDETTPTPSCEETGESPTKDVNDAIPASEGSITESSNEKIEDMEPTLDASSQESEVTLSAPSDQPVNGESNEPPSSVETPREDSKTESVHEIEDSTLAKNAELAHNSVLATEETPPLEPSDENLVAATSLEEKAENSGQVEESQSLNEAPKIDEPKEESAPQCAQDSDEPSSSNTKPIGESEAVVEAVKEADLESENATVEPMVSADEDVRAVEHADELGTLLEGAKEAQPESESTQVETDDSPEESKVDAPEPEPEGSSDQSTHAPAPVEIQTIVEPALEINNLEHKSDPTIQETPASGCENGPALIEEKLAPESKEVEVEGAVPQISDIANQSANAEETLFDNEDQAQVTPIEVEDAVTPATEELTPQADEALQPEETTEPKPEETHLELKPEQEVPVIEEAIREEPKAEAEAAVTEETAEPLPGDIAEEPTPKTVIDQESTEKDKEKDGDPNPAPGNTSAEMSHNSIDAVSAIDELEFSAIANEEAKALDSAHEPEPPSQEEKQKDEASVPQENVTSERSEPVLVVEEIQSPPSNDPGKDEPENPNEELASESVPETEEAIVTAATPSGDASQIAREVPDEEAASTPAPEVQESAGENSSQTDPEVTKDTAPVPLSEEPVEATLESGGLPLTEIAAGIAVGAIAATIPEPNDAPAEPEVLGDQAIASEPKQLAEVVEEQAPGEPPSPGSNKHRKHRSSRHSKGSSRQSSSRDGPSEEVRPILHRRRRESENSLKNLFFAPPSPKKPSRHDSGFSAGSTSPQSRKHRSNRTPEEQAKHEQRKAARKASKAGVVDSEVAIVDEPATELASSSIPTRRSSTRRHSSSRSSNARDDSEKKPKLLDMTGESVIKAKFIAIDKPHIKETVSKTSTKPIPIIDRPRFSMDGERTKHLERSNSSRHHHSHRSSNTKDRKDRDRHKIEEEKELRKAREETKRQLEHAQNAVAEESRKQQEKDDEERRLRREARRKRREEEDRANDDSPETSITGSKGKLVKDSRKYHSHGSEREKEKERERSKSKGPLKSLWSSAKKVFA